MLWPVQLMLLFRSRTADVRADHGATATEYAILMAFIAVVIVVGITTFGSQLGSAFTSFAEDLGIIAGS